MIRFDVVGAPAPQGSKKAFVLRGKNGAADRAILTESSKNVKGWRQRVAEEAQKVAPAQPFDGAVHIAIAFAMPVPKSAPKTKKLHATKRPDIDKLTRAVLDALKGVIWRDDSQVVRLAVTKKLAYDRPIGCSIMVWEVNDDRV